MEIGFRTWQLDSFCRILLDDLVTVADLVGFLCLPTGVTYPLANVYITMERSTIFHGQINYKWVKFNSFLYVYQRVDAAVLS